MTGCTAIISNHQLGHLLPMVASGGCDVEVPAQACTAHPVGSNRANANARTMHAPQSLRILAKLASTSGVEAGIECSTVCSRPSSCLRALRARRVWTSVAGSSSTHALRPWLAALCRQHKRVGQHVRGRELSMEHTVPLPHWRMSLVVFCHRSRMLQRWQLKERVTPRAPTMPHRIRMQAPSFRSVLGDCGDLHPYARGSAAISPKRSIPLMLLHLPALSQSVN